MSDPLTDDYRVDIGRADKGRTFVRVIHMPTGKERIIIGLGTAAPMGVATRLAAEIELEIQSEQRPATADRGHAPQATES